MAEGRETYGLSKETADRVSLLDRALFDELLAVLGLRADAIPETASPVDRTSRLARQAVAKRLSDFAVQAAIESLFSAQRQGRVSLHEEYLFACYNSLDRFSVGLCCYPIDTMMMPVWRDVSKINPGADWASVIREAIERARGWLVFCGPVLGAYQEQELKIILEDRGRAGRVIPCLLPAGVIPPELGAFHRLDLQTEPAEWLKLLRRVIG